MNSISKQTDVKKDGSIFVYSDDLAKFDFGPDHFFKPERAAKTLELCNRYGVMYLPWMDILKPEAIDESLLLLFHETEYLKILKNASNGEVILETLERGIGTEDNPILPGVFEWAIKVTGGTREALNRIATGRALAWCFFQGGRNIQKPGGLDGT